MFLLFVVLLSLLWCWPVSAAIDCDGVDDSAGGIQLSNYFVAGTKTLSVWYTSAGTPPAEGTCNSAPVQSIVANTGGVARMILTRRSSTILCVGHHDGGLDTLNTGATYTDGTLVNLTFVHSGGATTLYKDGVSVATGGSGDLSTLTVSLTVCGNTGVFAPAEGRIHHVLTSSSAMPAEEVAILASSKRPRLRRTAASGEWLFDNCGDGAAGNAVDFRDHSGNARTLTGDDGANNTGLTCRASTVFSYLGGMQ